MTGLTSKQSKILAFIRGQIEARGRSPSLREIADKFEIRSVNGVVGHVRALEKKGALARDPGSRALRLITREPSFAFAYGGTIS